MSEPTPTEELIGHPVEPEPADSQMGHADAPPF